MADRIAVLIDAENTSVNYIDVALQELKQYGDIAVQRMYGDFSTKAMKEWAKKGLELAILPIHQARYTSTKNASDIMLVIDAMDILFQGTADIFCIVTSDSDFTRLASRLREGGKKVIGMGKSNASKAFITACNEYKFLDIIGEKNDDETSDVSAKDSAITPLSEIKKTINYMLQQAENNGELFNLGSAKSKLQRQYADFDERNYGYTLFRKFIEEETKFVVKLEGSTAYITRRNVDKKQDETDAVESFILERAAVGIELGALGQELAQKFPHFKCKEKGYSKLSKYIESIDGVVVEKESSKSYVRRE